jgi:hypothetical protein
LIPLFLICLWTFRARKELGQRASRVVATEPDGGRRRRAGAAAGGLATIASTLLLNVVINLAGNLAFNAPGTIVERTADRLAFAFAREVQPGALIVAVPLYVLVGVVWGALYGAWGEPFLRKRHDAVAGLVFAVLPLLTSLLVVMPLLGLGFFGVGATGFVALIGETIRHASYGVLLGLLYPVLRARREVRVIPHTPEELAPEGAVVS